MPHAKNENRNNSPYYIEKTFPYFTLQRYHKILNYNFSSGML